MQSLNNIKNIYICSLHTLCIWDVSVKIKTFLFSLLQEISSLILTSLMTKEKNAHILEFRTSKMFYFH